MSTAVKFVRAFRKAAVHSKNIWISIKEGILKVEIEPKNNDKYPVTAMRGAHALGQLRKRTRESLKRQEQPSEVFYKKRCS